MVSHVGLFIVIAFINLGFVVKADCLLDQECFTAFIEKYVCF